MSENFVPWRSYDAKQQPSPSKENTSENMEFEHKEKMRLYVETVEKWKTTIECATRTKNGIIWLQVYIFCWHGPPRFVDNILHFWKIGMIIVELWMWTSVRRNTYASNKQAFQNSELVNTEKIQMIYIKPARTETPLILRLFYLSYKFI